MSKLMIAMPSDKTPPLYDFFNDELNEKQRQKLLSLFALMLQAPSFRHAGALCKAFHTGTVQQSL